MAEYKVFLSISVWLISTSTIKSGGGSTAKPTVQPAPGTDFKIDIANVEWTGPDQFL